MGTAGSRTRCIFFERRERQTLGKASPSGHVRRISRLSTPDTRRRQPSAARAIRWPLDHPVKLDDGGGITCAAYNYDFDNPSISDPRNSPFCDCHVD
jgi:hypothetical protein